MAVKAHKLQSNAHIRLPGLHGVDTIAVGAKLEVRSRSANRTSWELTGRIAGQWIFNEYLLSRSLTEPPLDVALRKLRSEFIRWLDISGNKPEFKNFTWQT